MVITDSSGTIARGVQSVQFVFSAPVNGTGGALVLQEIDIAGAPTGTYEAWKLGAFTTDAQRNDPAISGVLATPANDGMTNLMKYALGLDPMACGTADLPTISQQGGYLTLTCRKNKQAADVTTTVQVGDSLIGNNWSTASTVVSQTDAGNFWLVTVRDTVTMAGHPARFMRLQVSH
jgi:hypothetical protein